MNFKESIFAFRQRPTREIIKLTEKNLFSDLEDLKPIRSELLKKKIFLDFHEIALNVNFDILWGLPNVIVVNEQIKKMIEASNTRGIEFHDVRNKTFILKDTNAEMIHVEKSSVTHADDPVLKFIPPKHLAKSKEELNHTANFKKGDVIIIEEDGKLRLLSSFDSVKVDQNKSLNLKLVSTCSRYLDFLTTNTQSKILYSTVILDKVFLRQIGTYYKLEEHFIENIEKQLTILVYKYKGLGVYMKELVCKNCDDIFIIVYAIKHGGERPPLPHTWHYIGSVEKHKLLSFDSEMRILNKIKGAELATRADILEFEKYTSIVLPEYFKEFLQTQNVISVKESLYKKDSNEYWVSDFYPLTHHHDLTLKSSFDNLNDFYQNKYLAFANDGGGWQFVISVNELDYGNVFLSRIDSDLEDSLMLLAEDFNTFIDGLETYNSQPTSNKSDE